MLEIDDYWSFNCYLLLLDLWKDAWNVHTGIVWWLWFSFKLIYVCNIYMKYWSHNEHLSCDDINRKACQHLTNRCQFLITSDCTLKNSTEHVYTWWERERERERENLLKYHISFTGITYSLPVLSRKVLHFLCCSFQVLQEKEIYKIGIEFHIKISENSCILL